MPRAGGGGAAKNATKKNKKKKEPKKGPGKGVGGGSGAQRRVSSKEQAFIDLNANEDILNNNEEFALMCSKYSREAFHDAEALPAVVLINNGKFNELTIADVSELFAVLDNDGSGALEFDEIRLLLKEVIKPSCTDAQIESIYAQTDPSGDGIVSPEEFLFTLTGPVKEEIKRMQRDNATKEHYAKLLDVNLEIERDLMLDSFRSKVTSDDAFRTLPQSLVYMFIFVFLVIAHLQILERQTLERGLKAWIDGYGSKLLGPYLGDVGNVDGMFGWLTESGLNSIFSDCRNVTAGDPMCRVGTRNILLGDVQLQQNRRDGSKRSVWLLHLDQAQDHLTSMPGDYRGAAIAAANYLHGQKWADEGTMALRMRFTTYGPRTHLFALTDVRTAFDDFGFVMPRTFSHAVVVIPYPDDIGGKIIKFMFDAFYSLFIVIPVIKETRDLVKATRISGVRDGCSAYWDLWNIVDWVCIVTGIGSVTVWCLCVQAMTADSITSVLKVEEDQRMLARGVMFLSESSLDTLIEDCGSIITLFSALRVTMAATSMSILLKFFKAFQANPRLQVVTNTMVNAFSDIIHFSIVFVAVFLGYAVTGHILFGNDIVEFRSFSGSINTCFIVLMGVFDFYVSFSESELGPRSGMPYIILALWFWSYMIFVLMILINMLLAIILDHYTELVEAIKLDIDVPSLWQQAFRYIANAKQTKSHIPLETLAILLEDDDAMCHPEDIVTYKSLMMAFPEMLPQQGKHIVTWLKQETKKAMHEADSEIMARFKVLEEFVEAMTEDMHVVKLNSAVTTSRLKEKELMKASGAPPQVMSAAALSTMGLDQLSEQVDRLLLKFEAAVRDVTGRMEGASRNMSNHNVAMQLLLSGPAQEQPMPRMNSRMFNLCCSDKEGEGGVVKMMPCDRVDSRPSSKLPSPRRSAFSIQ